MPRRRRTSDSADGTDERCAHGWLRWWFQLGLLLQMGRFGPNRYGGDGGLLLGIGCSVVVHVSCADSLLSSMFLFVLVRSCSFLFVLLSFLHCFLPVGHYDALVVGFANFWNTACPSGPSEPGLRGGELPSLNTAACAGGKWLASPAGKCDAFHGKCRWRGYGESVKSL